jgi:hypothetical protein
MNRIITAPQWNAPWPILRQTLAGTARQAIPQVIEPADPGAQARVETASQSNPQTGSML